MTDDKDPRTTRYSVGTAPTQPAREAVRLPRTEPRTLADLDESIAKRLAQHKADIVDDARLREQRLRTEIGAVVSRVDVLEDEVRSAKSASGHSLETAATASKELVAVRKLTSELAGHVAELKQQPAAIAKASTDAGAELAGLISDLHAGVKKWGTVAALIGTVLTLGASYLASRGTAKEAATEAVQSAPKPQERIVVIQQPAPAVPAAPTGSQ